jgi:hypothetical protein
MFSGSRRHQGGHQGGDSPLADSLAVAWWVRGVLLTAVAIALELRAADFGLVEAIASRRGYTLWMVGGTAFFLLLPAWQVIGIFRCAARTASTRPGAWSARTIQVLTTLLTVLFAARFMAFAGETASGARLAWPLSGGAWQVTISHHGRLLEISGGLLFGVADAAEAALGVHPNVRRVRLNSGGGSLSEGRRLRELIQRHALDTDSTSGCSSACVSAYLGGKHRLLRRSARLGFHLPRTAGYGVRSAVSPEYARELAWFGRAGIPRDFLQRWIDSGRAFWYPQPRQLQAAGFVHTFFGRPRPDEAWLFYR